MYGGGIKGAVNGAIAGGLSGGVLGGVEHMTSGANGLVRASANVAAKTSIAYVEGGDWKKAFKTAGLVEMGRAAWTYTKNETDKLYDASCSKSMYGCKSDAYGRLTDGGRVLHNPDWLSDNSSRIPSLIRAFIGGGMDAEGSGTHAYDSGGWICGAFGDGFCSTVKGFVRDVSKPHDWGNSFGYDKTGDYGCLGCRIVGGGFDSLYGQVGYEMGMQAWSFSTMPVAASFTFFSKYGDTVDAYRYSGHP